MWIALISISLQCGERLKSDPIIDREREVDLMSWDIKLFKLKTIGNVNELCVGNIYKVYVTVCRITPPPVN